MQTPGKWGDSSFSLPPLPSPMQQPELLRSSFRASSSRPDSSSTISSLQDALFSARLEVRMLQDALSSRFPGEAGAVASEMVQLRVQVASLKRELESKNALLAKSKSALSSLHADADVAAARAKLSNAGSRQVSSLQATVTELSEVVDAQAARIMAAEAAEELAAGESARMNTKLAELALGKAQVEGKLGDANITIARLQDEIDALKSSGNELSARVDDMAGEVAAKDLQIAALGVNLDEASLALQMERAEAALLARNLSDAESTIVGLQAQLAELAEKDGNLIQSAADFRAQAQVLATQVEEERAAEEARWEAAVEELRQEAEVAASAASLAQASLAEQLDDANATSAALRESLGETSAALDEANRLIKSLEESIQAKNDALGEAEGSIRTMTQAHSDALDHLRSEIRALVEAHARELDDERKRSSRQAAEATTDHYATMDDQAKRIRAECQAELDSVRAQYETAVSELQANLEAAREEYAATLDALRSDAHNLQAESESALAAVEHELENTRAAREEDGAVAQEGLDERNALLGSMAAAVAVLLDAPPSPSLRSASGAANNLPVLQEQLLNDMEALEARISGLVASVAEESAARESVTALLNARLEETVSTLEAREAEAGLAQDQISALSSELDRARDVIEELKGSNLTLSTEISSLRRELDATSLDREMLLAQNESARETINSLNRSTDALNHENDDLRASLGSAQSLQDVLESSSAALMLSNFTRQELELKLQSAMALEAQLESKRGVIDNLRAELQDAHNAHSEVVAALSAEKDGALKLKEELATLKAQLAAAETVEAQLTDRITELGTSLARAEDEAKTKVVLAEDLSHENARLRKELEFASADKTALARAETKLEATAGSLTEAREEIIGLKAELSNAEFKFRSRTQAEMVEETNRALQERNRSLASKLDSEQGRAVHAERMRSDLEAAHIKLVEAESRASLYKVELDNAKSTLASLRAERASLASRVDAAGDAALELTRIRAELARKEDAIAALQSQRHALERDASKVSVLQSQVSSLQSALDAKDREMERRERYASSSANAEATSRIRELETALTRAKDDVMAAERRGLEADARARELEAASREGDKARRDADDQVRDLRRQLADASRHAERATSSSLQLEARSGEVARLQAQIQDLKHAARMSATSSANETDRLVSSHAKEVESVREHAKAEISSLRTQLENAMSQISSLNASAKAAVEQEYAVKIAAMAEEYQAEVASARQHEEEARAAAEEAKAGLAEIEGRAEKAEATVVELTQVMAALSSGGPVAAPASPPSRRTRGGRPSSSSALRASALFMSSSLDAMVGASADGSLTSQSHEYIRAYQAASEAQVEAASLALEESEGMLAETRKELESTRRSLLEVEAEYAGLEGRYESALDDMRVLGEELESAQASVSALSERCKDTERELDTANARSDQMMDIIDVQKVELGKAKAEIMGYLKEKQAMESAILMQVHETSAFLQHTKDSLEAAHGPVAVGPGFGGGSFHGPSSFGGGGAGSHMFGSTGVAPPPPPPAATAPMPMVAPAPIVPGGGSLSQMLSQIDRQRDLTMEQLESGSTNIPVSPTRVGGGDFAAVHENTLQQLQDLAQSFSFQ